MKKLTAKLTNIYQEYNDSVGAPHTVSEPVVAESTPTAPIQGNKRYQEVCFD
jgi:hypothetical protein